MMKETLKLEISILCSVHILAIILAIVFFMIFYMKAKKDYSLQAFLVLQVSIIGWMVFKIFKTVSPTELSRWWFIVGYYFWACVFEVAFLEFVYSSYRLKAMRKSIRYVLYIVASIQFSWVVTNPYHHLFYSTYDFWGDSFGPLFYLHTAIEYGFIIVGFIYGYKIFKERFADKKTGYKLVIAAAIIIPLILNILFITKILHRIIFGIGIPVIFDITPLVFVFSIMVFAYASFSHKMINISPIMKHEIVDKLDTPICVLDSSFEVIYINQILKEKIGAQANKSISQALEKLDIVSVSDKSIELAIEESVFIVFIKKVNAFVETQYLLTFRDISEFKHIEGKILLEQDQLARVNDELEKTIEKLKMTSKIGARNYVAREMHDIIGHSLVVCIKLLEVAKLYIKRDRELSINALNDSVLSLETGIDTMNNISLKETSYTGESLEKDMNKKLLQLTNTGINVDMKFKGVYVNIEEKTYDIINRVILELLTNVLKHSAAEQVFLSIDVKQESIKILMMDNGKGVKDLQIGNGLAGIKERVRLIGGSVEFISSVSQGFMTKLTLNNKTDVK